MKRFLALLAMWLMPAASWACSPVEGYRTPTNFELVQKADLIVLARIVSGPEDMSGLRPEIAIEPVRVLKGTLPADPLRLMGSLKWNEKTIPSMPTPLAASHFSAGMGACVRIFYPRAALVLAMFQRTPADRKADFPYSMSPLFEPFARSAEDVESEDGVWVKAVQAYVALQASVDAGHVREAADRMRIELGARVGDLAAQAMADDLAYYLDQTAGGKASVHDEGVHWRAIDLPEESVALLGSQTVKARILRCRAGADAIELYWPEEEGAASAFRIGAQSFALTPASLTLSPDLKSASATVPLDARLRDALLSGADSDGVETRAGTISAPPLDILQKFAMRCGVLLTGKAGS